MLQVFLSRSCRKFFDIGAIGNYMLLVVPLYRFRKSRKEPEEQREVAACTAAPWPKVEMGRVCLSRP